MAVAAAQLAEQRRSLAAELSGISGRRRTKNLVMTALMVLAVVVVGFVLLLVLVTVVTKGWSIVVRQLSRLVHQGHPAAPRVAGPGHEGGDRRHAA